ncbi:15118_t:CDS:2, partial [Funneliformis geosporum]
LEEDGFVTPDEKAKELVKKLTDKNFLCALRLLFEDLQNEFSDQILINSLVALADPVPFKLNYSKESTFRLELHLRTWITILERICFSQIRLTKELRNKIYNSLTVFAEIHRKTAQIIGEGIENIFKSEFYQFNQQNDYKDVKIAKKRNYNIDFLLIQLRDTLHSLGDNETWFQEVLQRTKDLLKASLNITPGIVSIVAPYASIPNGNCSILSTLTQLRQSLSFEYPVASYYVDWRIMMIIKHDFIKWSEGSEKIISKKHGEMILIEYIRAYLEREWIQVADKTILDFQTKFDEESNRLIEMLRNTGRIFNDFSGNEPLELPHSLWFGLLDLVHELVRQSSKSSTYNQCYYLAIESLNKAPSSFIQFKAIEILLNLHDINSELFTTLDIDLDQYARELRENKFLINSSEKFKVLLEFIKKRYSKDVEIINGNTERKKRKSKDNYLTKDISYNHNLADEISDVPTDQLCLLGCQHMITLNNLKELKQAKCPQCRLHIENNKSRHLSQNTIYKNLCAQNSKPGHILPSIDFEDSDDSDSDSDNLSEIEFELIKEKNLVRATKSNSNTLFQSIMPNRTSKKQHSTYQNAMKELAGKNYERAIYWCQEFLKKFPKHYCIRCILGYIYRCLFNYEKAHVYLNEAIDIKPKNPIAYYINGEIYYRQKNYSKSIEFILKSMDYKIKMNNLNIILGSSYIFEKSYNNKDGYNNALTNFHEALNKDSNHYLCLKNCAFIYRKQKNHQKALETLDKLLCINRNDSLILCFYGEILVSLKKYHEAISYFTKANTIDPENVHNLINRATTYLILEKYNEALMDINRILGLDSLYSLAYYYRGLIFYIVENINISILDFKKCIQLNPNDDLAKIHLIYLNFMSHYRAYKKLNHKIAKIIAKIDRFSKIDDQIKFFIKCNIYIKLKMYDKALENFNRFFDLNRQDIQFLYFLRKYSGFLKYLCSYYNLDNKFIGLGIVEKFYIYMYFGVYFVSNLANIDSKYFHHIQEVNSKSLSRKVIHVKYEPLMMVLPNLLKPYWGSYMVWRICIDDVSSKDCSLNFIIKDDDHLPHRHTLTYEDLSKLIGLGWIEYSLPFTLKFTWVKPSIEIKNGFIDMKIDYVRFISTERDQNYIPSVQTFLPLYKLHPDVPEAFEYRIALGLSKIHKKSIIHRDLHSGNILINNNYIKIGDLGLSKSATEAEDNETYGIIPYIAPEVLQGKKYTIASDIYSFGMIMWECMTGRRPFWDRTHDTELIIDICDGLRPLTGIVAPEGYIELMKECWDPDQSKRPASGISKVKAWSREDVKECLQRRKVELNINDEVINILYDQGIEGSSFLELSDIDGKSFLELSVHLLQNKLPLDPVIRISNFINKVQE